MLVSESFASYIPSTLQSGAVTPEELRTWREKHKLNQQELADLLGVHWMTIGAWEERERQRISKP